MLGFCLEGIRIKKDDMYIKISLWLMFLFSFNTCSNSIVENPHEFECDNLYFSIIDDSIRTKDEVKLFVYINYKCIQKDKSHFELINLTNQLRLKYGNVSTISFNTSLAPFNNFLHYGDHINGRTHQIAIIGLKFQKIV
jgi:hypothetical protein